MRTEIFSNTNTSLILYKDVLENDYKFISNINCGKRLQPITKEKKKALPEILFITSYPPRECGIATYSHDLMASLNDKFSNSFSLKVCALETENQKNVYPDEVKFVLNTSNTQAFTRLAGAINKNEQIEIVLIQHEFGLFYQEEAFLKFLNALHKSVVVVFHTVLPQPNDELKMHVQKIIEASESVIVMTNNSSQLLINDYGIQDSKITVIPHGTHLVQHLDKRFLKEKYNLAGRKVFSTFGLLSAGKSIDTTLDAMPEIIKTNPDALFLVIGKTHPNVLKSEGEKYRNFLHEKVVELHLQNHVRFINQYLPLPELLEYLQLTDIYVFTSKDRNQAVSGTFSYAVSCGCPIISTPIPHALEVLGNDVGIVIDFENPFQLGEAVTRLFNDEVLRTNMSLNGLHKISSTAWENSAVAHAMLFAKISDNKILLNYSTPKINLVHIKRLTTDFGMIQFSKINRPDISSGYTLDDNARALIAMCMHYELTGDEADIKYISIYFDFIKHCQRPEGYFLNYVDSDKKFTQQNNETNLADSNGRAIWALGFLISVSNILPEALILQAEAVMQNALQRIEMIHSTRAMAFAIKGLHYYNQKNKSTQNVALITLLANRLVQMHRHESEVNWQWFESYLTYANSILPEALLCAFQETGDEVYKNTAQLSFDFLLSHTLTKNQIKVISNRSWMHKGSAVEHFGEQPIDVAYTILALRRFYDVFSDENYLRQMETAFNWFLGNNHLHQIIYNPCTGGCYDGLEENHINLNQGAESTVSYLMARLTMEKKKSQILAVKTILNKKVNLLELA